MPSGICRLCQEEKELLGQSHIIPEFMYQELFDEHHQIRRFRPVDLKKSNAIIQRPSSGEYDQGILCAACDNEIIGQYETYASQILYSRNELPEDIQPHCEDSSEITIFSNIDYNRLKLFILTILWRASISTRKMFSEINLGENENVIREMILQGNAGRPDEFPILLFTWLHDSTVSRDIILQPATVSLGVNNRYIMPIGGVVYNIITSLDPIPESLREYILQPDKVSLFKLPAGSGWKFILEYHGL